jgi:hypothetical protein
MHTQWKRVLRDFPLAMFDNTGGQSFGIGKFPPNDLQTQVIVEGFSPSCLVRKFTEAT